MGRKEDEETPEECELCGDQPFCKIFAITKEGQVKETKTPCLGHLADVVPEMIRSQEVVRLLIEKRKEEKKK